MTTAQKVLEAWTKFAELSDPTHSDPMAVELLRSPAEHAELIEQALEHIRLVDKHEGSLLGSLGYDFLFTSSLWRRGNEAVLQARAMQQVLCWVHRHPADNGCFPNIVARHTFEANFLYSAPRLRQWDGINFLLMPYVYQELLLLPAAALFQTLCVAAPLTAPWGFLDAPLPTASFAGTTPCSLRKLIARVITSNAFDPSMDGENPVAYLSRDSEWFVGIDDEASEPSSLEDVLAYSGQDFAIAHEIGHCATESIKLPYLEAEALADRVGMGLFATSWGWRDEVLDSCPLGQGARIFLGPIWFFFTARLLYKLRGILANRISASFSCDLSFLLGEADDAEHLATLAARWSHVASYLSQYAQEIEGQVGVLSELDVHRVDGLVSTLSSFDEAMPTWVASIPDECLFKAIKLVDPSVSFKR